MAAAARDLTVTRVLGLSRSGNHPIIDWILAQLPGPWCFLNCVEHESDPLRRARPTDDGRHYRSNVPAFRPESAGPGGLARLRHLLFSQEDCFLQTAWGPKATAIQEAAIGPAARWIDLLILRDPYNLFASRRRFPHSLVPERTALRIWKQHARAFLGRRTCLTRPVIAVSYNRWRDDRRYRQRLAQQLGLAFTDAGIDSVPACGGGSSFDGRRFQGRASEMPVHERWRHFAGQPDFHRLFDPQLRDFAGRIFGPPPWESETPDAGAETASCGSAGPVEAALGQAVAGEPLLRDEAA